MNETISTIKARRAVRKYKDKEVLRKLIDQILDAAKMSPSAMNRQPWKFYVVTKKKMINSFSADITQKIIEKMPGFAERIKSLGRNTEDMVFYGAPVVIFITAPKDNEWANMDVGICAQNIMLAAKSLGLDSCPVGFARFIGETKSLSQLNIPKTDEVKIAVIIGYGDEKPKPHEQVAGNVFFL